MLRIYLNLTREEKAQIDKIEGTGLGMAITKNIVDMMNGTIAVKSEQGVGTEATVCLTFRLNTGVIEPRDIPELKNCRALVVDDDFNTCDRLECGQSGLCQEKRHCCVHARQLQGMISMMYM